MNQIQARSEELLTQEIDFKQILIMVWSLQK
jgi:hypothetical protein